MGLISRVSSRTYRMIRKNNNTTANSNSNSNYKDIPKESQISQKTLEIVKSITLVKSMSDKTQQQNANQRINQQTNYLKQHIQDLKQGFICHSISTDKTLSVQQEQHE